VDGSSPSGQATADIRARIPVLPETSGFVPKFFLLLAHRPDEFRAFVADREDLMDQLAQAQQGRARPRQMPMLDFAMKISAETWAVCDAGFDTLRQQGFDLDDIRDMADVPAFFTLSDCAANVTSMRPNNEFLAAWAADESSRYGHASGRRRLVAAAASTTDRRAVSAPLAQLRLSKDLGLRTKAPTTMQPFRRDDIADKPEHSPWVEPQRRRPLT